MNVLDLFKKKKEYDESYFFAMNSESREFQTTQVVHFGIFSNAIDEGLALLDMHIHNVANNTSTFCEIAYFDYSEKIPVSVNGKFVGSIANIVKVDCNRAGSLDLYMYSMSMLFNCSWQDFEHGDFVEKFTRMINSGNVSIHIEKHENNLYMDITAKDW